MSKNGRFIFIMAFLMSLIAFAIDASLPAFPKIQESLNLAKANDVQVVIAFIFLGMAAGIMIYGPLSDSIGRKKTLYIGIFIFIIGSCFSALSTSLSIMLMGQFLQGFGGAACRVVSLAMVRDKFRGKEMGKIMSLIMIFFVLVPAMAPTVGQLISNISSWRFIFVSYTVLGICALIIIKFFQNETLTTENRIPFSIKNIISGSLETIRNPIARPFTISSSFMLGSFLGYLTSTQQIFQVQYGLGDAFPIYFASLALCIGVSSFFNSKLVDHFGMIQITTVAMIGSVILSALYLILLFIYEGHTPLIFFMAYLGMTFLFLGPLFGNLNAIAVHYLGHIAGIANSVISATQTFLSVLMGTFIGYLYSGNTYPLVIGFLIGNGISLMIVLHTKKRYESVLKL